MNPTCPMELLENRRLLAGDVTVAIETAAGGSFTEIALDGDAEGNTLTAFGENTAAGSSRVVGGATSVTLDTATLSTAAGLTVSSTNGTATPAGGFGVGFNIEEPTSLRYGLNSGFDLRGGEIRHTGTVSFNADAITVGDFAIGFDADRVGGSASGFFIADTVGGLGILFDIANPSVTAATGSLQIANVDLLVSPEFAQTLLDLSLASADLTGADVGDAQVDATANPLIADLFVVQGIDADGERTLLNGSGFELIFRAARVTGIDANLGDGDDDITLRDYVFETTSDILLPLGANELRTNNARFGDLDINGSGDGDLFSLTNTAVTGTLSLFASSGDDDIDFITGRYANGTIDAGQGNDEVTFSDTRFTGAFSISGGGDTDSLFAGDDARLNRPSINNFETVTDFGVDPIV
ncbi:MAG: hypothetical protein AAGD32_02225 [Planctomycetota bacterium]